jgi:hypothetical protein
MRFHLTACYRSKKSAQYGHYADYLWRSHWKRKWEDHCTSGSYGHIRQNQTKVETEKGKKSPSVNKTK